MKRVRELIEEIRHAHPADIFFQDFERDLESWGLKRAYYQTYNNVLCRLDEESWQLLKQKAISHFGNHRSGQLKQGFFNQLNEAFAYAFLVRIGYSNVRFVPEDGKTRPDLTYQEREKQRYCEVKTIGISQDEIERRGSGKFCDRTVYRQLSEELLNKLGNVLCQAQNQISSQGGDGIIYVVIRFDDFTLTNYPAYRKQLVNFLREYPTQEVFLRMGISGTRRIHKRVGC